MPNSSSDSSSNSLSVHSATTDLEANTNGAAAPSSSRAGERSPGLLRLLGSLWILVFRTGMLVVGSGIALAAGVAIATRYPAEEVTEPPVLERVLQGIERIR